MATSVLVVWAACCTVHGALVLKVHLIYSSSWVLKEIHMLKKGSWTTSRTLSFFLWCVYVNREVCKDLFVCKTRMKMRYWICADPPESLRVSGQDLVCQQQQLTLCMWQLLKKSWVSHLHLLFFLLCIAWRFEFLLSPFFLSNPPVSSVSPFFLFCMCFIQVFFLKAEVSEATQAHGVKLPPSTDLYTFALRSSHDRPSKFHKVIYKDRPCS